MDGAAVSVLGSVRIGICMPFYHHCTDKAGHTRGLWNMEKGYSLFYVGPVKSVAKIVLVGIIAYFILVSKVLYITTDFRGFLPFS